MRARKLENYTELGSIGILSGKNLPAAGLQVVGDGAVTGDSNLIGRVSYGSELENGDVRGRRRRGTGYLDSAVHAGDWGIRVGFRGTLLFRLRIVITSPPEKTHVSASSSSSSMEKSSGI
ncbi:hypothetical protein V2J09_014834 [Rumex salicifolius]